MCHLTTTRMQLQTKGQTDNIMMPIADHTVRYAIRSAKNIQKILTHKKNCYISVGCKRIRDKISNELNHACQTLSTSALRTSPPPVSSVYKLCYLSARPTDYCRRCGVLIHLYYNIQYITPQVSIYADGQTAQRLHETIRP